LTDYVFGYGSLAGELADGGAIAHLRGRRRVWGVAADNRDAIPGYKRYRLREDGSAPELFVAFLDLVEDPACAVNGVVAPVAPDELSILDLRERNYDRVEVSHLLDSPPGGRVFTWVGSAEGRARLEEGRRRGSAVVCLDYVEEVHAVFRALGDEHHARFLASSTLDGLPVTDLERIDLRDAGVAE
jgi:hypothetical protein